MPAPTPRRHAALDLPRRQNFHLLAHGTAAAGLGKHRGLAGWRPAWYARFAESEAMDVIPALLGAIILATLVPDCVSVLAGFGTALVAAALVLTGWLLGRFMRALRAKL